MLFATIATQFRRRKEAVNAQDLPVCPSLFVLAEANELAPTGIADGFGKVVVLDHASHVQRLKRDRAKPIDQFSTQFVLEVFSLIGYPFVQDGNGQTGMVAMLGTLNLATQSALPNRQSSLAAVQVPGLFDLLACTQGGKGGQSQVNAHGQGLGCWVWYFHLYLNADKVATGLGSRYGAILHQAINGAMEDGFDPAHFGQVDPSIVDFETLRIADTLFVVLAVEVWVVGTAFKEVDVRPIQVFQGLLQGLTVGFLQPGIVNLELLGQVVGAIVVGQARTAINVEAFTHSAVMVVHKARRAELFGEFSLLAIIRIQAKLKGFLGLHSAVSLRLHEQVDQSRPSWFCLASQQEVSTSYACPL